MIIIIENKYEFNKETGVLVNIKSGKEMVFDDKNQFLFVTNKLIKLTRIFKGELYWLELKKYSSYVRLENDNIKNKNKPVKRLVKKIKTRIPKIALSIIEKPKKQHIGFFTEEERKERHKIAMKNSYIRNREKRLNHMKMKYQEKNRSNQMKMKYQEKIENEIINLTLL